MKKQIISLILITFVTLQSCNTEDKRNENLDNTQPTSPVHDMPTSDLKDNDKNPGTGILKDMDDNTIEIIFENDQKQVTTIYNKNDTILLYGENTNDGMMYKNEEYELTGTVGNVELKKNGKVLFKNFKEE